MRGAPARCVAWAVGLAALVSPARAQPREPLPPYVFDARGATVSLPTREGWTPTQGSGSDVPGRGWAAEVGGHMYPLRLGPVTVGLGAAWVAARGRLKSASGTPGVTTRLAVVAPHLSFNFGHRLGWSYLSGGVGRGRVDSVAEGELADPVEGSKLLHYGGGARWFVRDRLAVGFDVRIYQLSPRPATLRRPPGPRLKQVALAAGVSFR